MGMTYEEKYSKCDTIKKLEEKHLNDIYAINGFEELGVCDRAYANRYRKLLQIKSESIGVKPDE